MLKFLSFENNVSQAYAGVTAKAYLANHFDLSQTRIKAIRLRGALYINGRAARMITKLNPGDHLRAVCPDLESPSINLQAILDAGCSIAYQDPWLLVINKPAGLLVHPSYKENHSLTYLLSSSNLHPVRRLDRDTSGLVPISLNPHCHELLQRQSFTKRYRVLVHGRLPATRLSLETRFERNPAWSIQRIVRDCGQIAVSHFREWAYFPDQDVSLLDVNIDTGRTHQIRSHCLYLGLPILGDWLYGKACLTQYLASQPAFYSLEAKQRLECLLADENTQAEWGFERQALDADSIEFVNPYNQAKICLQADLPTDFRRFFQETGIASLPNRPKL